MAHLVTGYAGKPHVIPQNQADMNARVIGAGSFMLGGGITATKKSNSSIEISAEGCLMAYGRQIEIETEAVAIMTGTSGKFRKDYIVMTYSMDYETGVETAFLQVLKGDEASTKGTVVAPSYTDVPIDGDVTLSQILLFSVDINGIDIETITKELTDVVDSPINEMKEINDETPTYEESKDISQLTSGEKISIAFGKLKKAVASLISHIADMAIHITEEERTAWNAKASGTALSNHISDKENPHGVTASQVGALPSTTKYAASSSIGGAASSCSGNSATASKLETAVKINGVDFDGSEDITLPEITEVAKAEVAGKLETAVKINGVEFDGSKDITLPSATHTETADEATKAQQDAEGNVITETYATIESLSLTNESVATNAENIATNSELIDGLNSNLDGLGYGENSAKNLFKDYDVMRSYKISSETYNGYPIIYSNKPWEGAYQSDLILKSGVTYTISAYIKGNGRAYLFSSLETGYMKSTALTDNFERFSLVYTPNVDISEIRIENGTDGGLYIACFQIEEGDTLTQYNPYIPSVKMLADKSTQIDDNNMLGYVVPNEMPIKNYVDSNGVFHQRVKRIDLGDISWNYHSDSGNMYADGVVSDRKMIGDTITKSYCNKYAIYEKNLGNVSLLTEDKSIGMQSTVPSRLVIRDTSYTDATTFKNAIKGVYLYYELAEEKTISVDGNEAVTKVNESLSDYGLVDVFDGVWTQGYFDEANETFNTSANYVHSNYYKCVGNKPVTFHYTESGVSLIAYFFTDSGYIGRVFGKSTADGVVFNAPSNATRYVICVNRTGITPSNAQNARLYINNAIDGLKNDLGGVKFGIDENGNYGYIKAGADTVIPFKSGGGEIVLEELASDSASVTNGSFTKTVSAERQSSTGEDIQGFITIIDEGNTTGYATWAFNSGTHETTLISKDVSAGAETVGEFRVFYDKNDGSEGTFDVTISGNIGSSSSQYMKANVKILGVYAK